MHDAVATGYPLQQSAMVAMPDLMSVAPPHEHAGYSHQAFLYDDDRAFLVGTVAFITEGLANGEAVLVALPERRRRLVHDAFPGPEPRLSFASMEELGRNPAWILPRWTAFVQEHTAGLQRARGIGEPCWAGRSDDELNECARHEALLNVAFGASDGFSLLCPYDASALDEWVIDTAVRNHPELVRSGTRVANPRYEAEVPTILDTPLSEVPVAAQRTTFSGKSTAAARRQAMRTASDAGLADGQTDDFVVAVCEAVTNSISYGGGVAEAYFWSDGGRAYCEVRDRGLIEDPLAGRRAPARDRPSGRGLWLMHQLCDLVQLRRRTDGQSIRLVKWASAPWERPPHSAPTS